MREFESHSSIGTYCTCPRKYRYKYIDGYEPREVSKQLRVGKAWGLLLENDPSATDQLSDFDRQVIELTYDCYRKFWGEEPDVQREVPFEYRPVRGVFDGLVPGSHVIESKFTKSWINTDYWRALELNQQAMLYLYVAQALGHDVEYITYDVTRNMVQKPGIKYLQYKETVPEYLERLTEWIYKNRYDVFQRRELSWSPAQLEENYHNMCTIIGSMPVAGDYFPQYKSGCRAYNNICEYFAVCTGEEKLTNTELYSIRKRA